MKTVEVAFDTYVELLGRRREEFWVKIPDVLWNFVVPEHVPDLIRKWGDTDPVTIVDNLAVNTEWCTIDNWDSPEKYQGQYASFADVCEQAAVAYNDRVAVLKW